MWLCQRGRLGVICASKDWLVDLGVELSVHSQLSLDGLWLGLGQVLAPSTDGGRGEDLGAMGRK